MRKLSRSDTWVLVMLLVAGMTFFGFFVFGQEQESSPEPRPQAATTVVPGNIATTSPANITPANTTADNQLVAQLRGFMQAYYLQLPADTMEQRRQRLASIRPPLPATFLSSLNLFGSPPEMTAARLTRRGQLKEGSVLQHRTGSPNGDYVTAQVITQVIDANGKVTQISTLLTSSVWKKQSKSWTPSHFTQGGE